MGTVASFHVYGLATTSGAPAGTSAGRAGTSEDEVVQQAVDAACQILHDADAIFSTWKPESALSRYRAGEASIEAMPPEFSVVAELCLKAKQLTDGWFDPWALPGGFDPTGLVKGWATERAAGVLVSHGIATALVNAGGDIATLGSPLGGWRVGIRHPWRAQSLAGVIELGASAIATSGRYERGDHLLNPRAPNDSSPPPVASATVTGQSLAFCDAFATALAVGGDDVFALLGSMAGYDCYMIKSDGTEEATPGIVFAAA
jgi:thiamine biosynthesis lipoprotein